SIGLVGLGQFGSCFADLFKSHPLVDRVALCDREPERMEKYAEMESWQDKFNRKDMYESLDEICKSDLDALVIITQPWLHAPQCIQAMESGKDVYSAVPIIAVPDGDEILECCNNLVETVKRTGKHYMLGETTYYRPATMFCRRKAAEGTFGDFVYAEGEYFHDVDASCSLREVNRKRLASKAGQEWNELSEEYAKAGIINGPMHYPTHSTSGPVCVMNAHAIKVNAYGHRNKTDDPYMGGDITDETALFKMSNGATVRICEFREVAGTIADSETFRVLGTAGTYAENTWKENFRKGTQPAKPLEITTLTNEEMRDPLPLEVAEAFKKVHNPDATPDDDFVPTGHGGSHPYLVHEFVDAVAGNRVPAINIWEAARYMAMGVMAHKSALKDGETLEVPDWGDAPSS
ncbi:MAG: Gfo/Idh/MocA family oxidoreductase, partial [Phycisphaerae bacterium]|nr:Gfo/Idh/MocA family oxidoreductase [Phycisphaerae bacterium]